MFAVIRTGGKQYRVAENDVIAVEKLDGGEGVSVTLDQVLMVGDDKNATIGAPLVAGASVTATVLEQACAGKIIVFKKKRRKNYRRKAGHHQNLTVLRINDIRTAGAKALLKKAEVEKPTSQKAETKKAKPAKKAPEKKAPEKKAVERKPAAKKAEAKKAEAKKAKPAAKKTPAKKPAAKKTPKQEK